MLGAIGRMILTLIVVFLVLATAAGIFAMILKAESGPMISVYREGSTAARVAILEVATSIDDRAAEYTRQAVNTILDMPEVKAVVFRVDSPGGGVTASDQIWYQVGRLKKAGLPIVASYGSVAASGGYYISCHSDYIIAEPTTVTGSIGVLMQALTLGGLLDKVGIEPVTMVAEDSPQKNVANDLYRAWTEEDRAKIQPILDQSYAVFFDRVYEGRKHVVPDADALRLIADGSVYTADEAKANGLIDDIGYLDNAIDHAIKSAGISSDSQAVRLQRWTSPFELPFGLEGGKGLGLSPRTGGRSRMAVDAEELRLLWHELTRPKAMFLTP